jgi:hypothetical protein
MMRPVRQRIWFRLRWPNEVTPEQVAAALSSLNSYATPRGRDTLVLLAVGKRGDVTHYLAAPESRSGGARRQLEAAIGGLTVEPVEQPPGLKPRRAWRGWMSSRVRPLETSRPEARARSLLTALASTVGDEALVIRWVLGPVHRPVAVRRHSDVDEIGLGLPPWLAEVTGRRRPDDAETRRALADKQGRPGWRAVLHLGVVAVGRRRQRQLLGRLAGAIRAAQGPGAHVGFRPTLRSALDRLPLRRPLMVNVDELPGVAGWPIGSTDELPVDRERSRLLPPDRAMPRGGRVVAESTYPGADRPLVLSARDALHHLHLIGPTGVGKTTALLNLIVQDMTAGRSVVVLEPRGDLVQQVLARVPDERVDDVVVIDPTDDAPVGINPLATPDVDAELRADHILAVFKGLFADSWGPRTQDILTAGLLTLTTTPGTTLAALPVLFNDDSFRAPMVERAVARDRIALGSFWAWFDALGPAERGAVLAPVMNKVRAFLLRERLRRVVCQPQPRFDLRDVFRRRMILAVTVAADALGPESSALLGSLVVSQLWQTVLGRAAVPPERRHPVMVYVDEWQRYVRLPTDLADVLAEARGLGVGLTLAHQHLAQLPQDLRPAVLANARSRVVFATQHDDAQVLVRGTERLGAADVVGLGRYSVYASLLADGERTPWASGRTLPAPPATRPGDDLRARSRARWGVPGRAIDTELELLAGNATPPRPQHDAGRFGVVPLLTDQEDTP